MPAHLDLDEDDLNFEQQRRRMENEQYWNNLRHPNQNDPEHKDDVDSRLQRKEDDSETGSCR